jgi:hypothetical protein
MAIEKTRSVVRLEVHPGVGDEDPRVTVMYENTFDDPNDDELPVKQVHNKYLVKSVTTVDESDPENPVEIVTPTDISGEDIFVQTVCNAIWG